MATGRQLWDASLVTAPSLVVASEGDFWSHPEDRELLADRLVHSARVKVVTIPGATHLFTLIAQSTGRAHLPSEISDFLVPKCCLRSENRGPLALQFTNRASRALGNDHTSPGTPEVDSEKLHFQGSLLQ
jgi:hypothetical protein